jgi:hypothetical protein
MSLLWHPLYTHRPDAIFFAEFRGYFFESAIAFGAIGVEMFATAGHIGFSTKLRLGGRSVHPLLITVETPPVKAAEL